MHRFYLVGLVVLALVAAIVLPGSVASAPGGEGIANTEPGVDVVTTCSFKAPKIDGITDSGTGKTTTSTSFVDIPNTTIGVNIGGSATTCVKVEFSAYAFASANSTLMFIQVTRDGLPCTPGPVQFVGDDDEDGDGRWARSHAFNFLCTGVTPGVHTFKAQFRSLQAGDTVAIHGSSLFVHHR